MNGFSQVVARYLEQGSNFQYCFRLHMSDERILSFVEAEYDITHGLETFSAAASWCLEKIESNDCAEDNAVVCLVPHRKLINCVKDFIGKQLEILLYFPQHSTLETYKSFKINEVKEDGMRVRLVLRSIAHHLHQNMLPLYSRTCRANLGDSYCKLPQDRYCVPVVIEAIEGSNALCCSHIGIDLSLLSGGVVSCDEFKLTFRILSVSVGKITIIGAEPAHLESLRQNLPYVASLKAVCDKKLATCSQQYDNAVNFRGEPFIPGFEQFKL